MHQVDRGIGLQDVAPGPLAGMGLAGDKQHPQTLPHAVDHHGNGVVGQAELVRQSIDLHLHHAGPATLQHDGDLRFLADGDVDELGCPSVDPHAQRNRVAHGRFRQVVDPEAEGGRLADDREVRRLRDGDPAVALLAAAAAQQMHRRIDAKTLEFGRDIVHLAVADHEDAGDALARDFGHVLAQCREKLRARGRSLRPGGAGAQNADLRVRQGVELLQQLAQGFFALLGAGLDVLALAFVQQHEDEVGNGFPLFGNEGRVGQYQYRGGDEDRPPGPAARP